MANRVVKWRLLLATLSAVALLIVSWVNFASAPTDEPDYAQLQLAERSQPRSAELFAASLQGTRADGKLETVQDQLVLNPELLHLFDYYLATQGERNLPEIIAQVKQELKQRLGLKPQAMAQALALFERYLAYKHALVTAPPLPATRQLSQTELMQRNFDFLQSSRAQFFSSAEIQALFSDEQVRNNDALQRMKIFDDISLTAEQKQVRYEALDQALPAALRAEKNAPVYIQQIEQQVAQMRANGKDEQAIYEFRALSFSADAAARLTELEREERVWQQRIFLYQAKARQIIHQHSDSGLASTNLNSVQSYQLYRLRQESFTAEEIPRLLAYETWSAN